MEVGDRVETKTVLSDTVIALRLFNMSTRQTEKMLRQQLNLERRNALTAVLGDLLAEDFKTSTNEEIALAYCGFPETAPDLNGPELTAQQLEFPVVADTIGVIRKTEQDKSRYETDLLDGHENHALFVLNMMALEPEERPQACEKFCTEQQDRRVKGFLQNGPCRMVAVSESGLSFTKYKKVEIC